MNNEEHGVVEIVKELVADPTKKIKLDDYVTELLKSTIQTLSADTFWVTLPAATPETIQARLRQYEECISDLVSASVLLARWGQADHLLFLDKIFTRMAQSAKPRANLHIWNLLHWYPLSLLTYSSGIAALSARNYSFLRPTILTPVASAHDEAARVSLVVRLADEMTQLTDVFKMLPGLSQKYAPHSEHMLEAVRSTVDGLLYLGDSYEAAFDEFEIISALSYCDLAQRSDGRFWARAGRFAWKRRFSGGGPYGALIVSATSQGQEWPLLRQGLFRSSSERFAEVAQGYSESLNGLNWF